MKILFFLLLNTYLFALSYATAYPWDIKTLEWAKKFDIAEVGPLDELDGVKLDGFKKKVAYEWMAGFYKNSTSSFNRWVYLHKNSLTLNPFGPHIMGEMDFYYDMCNPALQEKRADYLSSRIKELGLDGLFFDWANEEFLKEPQFKPIYGYFKKLHPNRRYQDCLREFLKRMKQKDILIVTNQSFRNPQLLDYTDYDMSESYITTEIKIERETIIDGKPYPYIPATLYYPIDENNRSIMPTYSYLRYLDYLKSSYAVKNIIYLNYAAPKLVWTIVGYRTKPPKDAIHYGYAFAKLFDAIAYTQVPFNRELEKDDIYFTDMGKPVSKIKKIDGGFVRYFEKGIVAVHEASPFTLELKRDVYDTKEGRWLKKGKVVINPAYDNIMKEYIPVGRVFLYNKPKRGGR